MKRGRIEGAKLTVTVCSSKGQRELYTLSVHDNRTGEDWPQERTAERGILAFNDLTDLEATLNWCLNGDTGRYVFQWGQSGRSGSTGYAYIFD